MTAHTPGPWHTAADAQNITTAAGALIARVALKQTVCGAPTANARLIAAAPDLLAVLRMAYGSAIEAKRLAHDPASVRALLDAIERETGLAIATATQEA